MRQRDAGLRASEPHLVADEPRLAGEDRGDGVLETDGDNLGRKAAQLSLSLSLSLWLRLDLDPTLRAGTTILAPTHALRVEIDTAIRHGPTEEDVLHGRALEIGRYVNLHLTRPQKGGIASYRPVDVAIFHHDVDGVRARAGDP